MNQPLLQLLKVAAPPAPIPPPNPVSAPTVSVTAPGQGTPAPRVTPSATNGQSANFAADPLTVAPPTAPGATELYEGRIVTPEIKQQLEQKKMLDQAEAEKNAPKEQKPVAADTPLTSHLMGSWSSRLKAASSPSLLPEKTLPHGSVREIPSVNGTASPQAAYNPFDRKKHPGMAGAYAGLMKAVKAPLYRKQHAQAFAGELAKRPDLQYNQHLARRVSDMATTGSTANQLWALGANLLGSFMGQGTGQQVTDQIQQHVQ